MLRAFGLNKTNIEGAQQWLDSSVCTCLNLFSQGRIDCLGSSAYRTAVDHGLFWPLLPFCLGWNYYTSSALTNSSASCRELRLRRAKEKKIEIILLSTRRQLLKPVHGSVTSHCASLEWMDWFSSKAALCRRMAAWWQAFEKHCAFLSGNMSHLIFYRDKERKSLWRNKFQL